MTKDTTPPESGEGTATVSPTTAESTIGDATAGDILEVEVDGEPRYVPYYQ